MKTPERITLEDFRRELVSFIVDRCSIGEITTLDHGLSCIDCGTRIQMVFPYVSIHTLEFENCAGYGTVEHPPIPFCPKCEPVPNGSGCVHIPHRTAKAAIQRGEQLTQGLLSAIPLRLLRLPNLE